MKKLHIKDPKKPLKNWRLETGFSMLEAVVVVGVLLALAVGGFFAYGTITDNAKTAAVKSAASQVHTAILVASFDGDPATTSTTVMDDWNNSNDRIKVKIIGDTVEIGAMTAGEVIPSEPDVCVQAKYVDGSNLSSLAGSCDPLVPTDSVPTETPTPTPTVPPAPVISTGYVASWGDNNRAELGNGTNVQSGVPTESLTKGLLVGKQISAITAGSNFSCAISEGKAWCWGDDRYGQLGDGVTGAISGYPLAVKTNGVLSGKTVTALAAGASHTCAIADGEAFCWGYNANGQLGNKSLIDSSVPVKVDTSGVLAGKTITAIYAAANYTCALASDAAYCWGSNGFGQLGNNKTVDSSSPVAVDTAGVLAGKKITSLSQGQKHACALADGSVFCWGANGDVQLGNGNITQSLVPVAVNNTALAGKTITSIASGTSYTCEIADGVPYCWGTDFTGGMGNKLNKATTPTSVDTSGVLEGKTITFLQAKGSNTCAIADNAPYCWGANNYGQLGNNAATSFIAQVPVAVNTAGVLKDKKIISLVVGGIHSVALYS